MNYPSGFDYGRDHEAWHKAWLEDRMAPSDFDYSSTLDAQNAEWLDRHRNDILLLHPGGREERLPFNGVPPEAVIVDAEIWLRRTSEGEPSPYYERVGGASFTRGSAPRDRLPPADLRSQGTTSPMGQRDDTVASLDGHTLTIDAADTISTLAQQSESADIEAIKRIIAEASWSFNAQRVAEQIVAYFRR